MTTIIERDVSGGSGISSALTAIVAIIAIVFVVGIVLYMLGLYPFNSLSAGTTATPSVNVNIKGVLPTVPSSNP